MSCHTVSTIIVCDLLMLTSQFCTSQPKQCLPAKAIPYFLLALLCLQAALLVLEAQLSLLLSLASAGGPSSRKGSTKAVADTGALPLLTACKALDYTPEQPSSHQRLKKSGSLR